MDDLLELDRARVWHPYGPMPAVTPPLPVVSASGVRLKLADGRELVDGMASWWCAIHGYRHPVLDAAVTDQLGRMAHVMFGGLTHEPAIRLAERLTDWTGLDHVFFADSGSVSVEVAIKLVMQAWHGERTKLLTWRGGYHGDTFGAMAVCDPDGGMHSMWRGLLPEHVFAPLPRWDAEWEQEVRDLFEQHTLAGVIVEPIVQGAGGMRFHPPECVQLLRELCDEHGIFLILDEIATGFGRTGELFAAAHLADVLCLGKALTGGYMTLAATLCTAAVAERLNGPLMHGPTFMANPLATAAALASTGILENGSWRADVARIEAGLRAGLKDAPAEVRVKGAIGVIELDHDVDVPRATQAAVEAGVWLRPFRNLIYAMPPYVTDDEDVARIAAAMVSACAIVVTGTDTGVGKTYVSAALADRSTAYVKAAQTGDDDDARTVQELSGAEVHTLARYPDPLAPATAAKRAGVPAITPTEIADFVPSARPRKGHRRGRRRAPRPVRRRDDRRRRAAARRAADRRRPRRPRHAQPHGADRGGDRAPRPRMPRDRDRILAARPRSRLVVQP